METQPYRRRRPALSCIECRRRKIKCDRAEPCAHCVNAKTRCAYKKIHRVDNTVYQQSHSASSPTRKDSTLVSIAERPTDTQSQLKQSGYAGSIVEPAPAVAQDTYVPDGSGHPGTLVTSETTQNSATYASATLPTTRPSEPVAITGHAYALDQSLNESGRSSLALQAKVHDGQISLDKDRVIKWRQWKGVNSEFAAILAFYKACSAIDKAEPGLNDEVAIITAAVCDLLAECKNLARMTKVGRPSRNLPHFELSLTPPDRTEADLMTNLYLGAFESTHRILHVPTFRMEYQSYWDNSENASISLSLKVLLIVAIGSSLSQPDDADPEFRKLAHQWVYVAENWLSGPLEKDRLDMNGLQIYCLTILARQVLSIGGDLIWMSMGSLIHRAMQAGLHRDPKHLPRMSVLQAEVRRRLWATVLEFAVQSSLDAQMPPRIAFDEFDTEAPSNINDDELDATTTSLQPHPRNTYTAASMQLTLLDLLPVRLRIVKTLNGLNSELSYHDVLALSADMLDACRICTEFLRMHEHSKITAFHRNLFEYLVRRFLLPLHCPFASQASVNPLFSYSLKLGLDTAITLMSPDPDAQYQRLRVVGGSMFKEGSRIAASTIALGLLAEIESRRMDGTLKRTSHHRDFLKRIMNDLIALSSERLQHGETNVKGHMFLSMVMAQVEAIEKGLPCEIKIAQSAQESLELCRSVLRSQVESLSMSATDDSGLPMFCGDDIQCAFRDANVISGVNIETVEDNQPQLNRNVKQISAHVTKKAIVLGPQIICLGVYSLFTGFAGTKHYFRSLPR